MYSSTSLLQSFLEWKFLDFWHLNGEFLRILGSIICRSVTSFTRKNDAFGLPKLTLTAASAYRYLRPVSSDEKHRNAVRTLRQIYCILNVSLPIHMMFPHFPVLPFPSLEFWSCVFRSCDFHPCDLVSRFPVPRFPIPRFQSLPHGDVTKGKHSR